MYKYKLSTIRRDDVRTIKPNLKNVFCNLRVMESKRRIVGVSKAMHFLFPDLIMPIDSKYTMNLFYGHNKFSHNCDKEFKTFMDIFKKCFEIKRDLVLTEQDVTGVGHNTSLPKLIDNACIGFYKYAITDGHAGELGDLFNRLDHSA